MEAENNQKQVNNNIYSTKSTLDIVKSIIFVLANKQTKIMISLQVSIVLLLTGAIISNCLPIEHLESGSGMPPPPTGAGTIDCSQTTKPTDLKEINAGLDVISKYIAFGVKPRHHSCKVPPVDISPLNPSTRYIPTTEVDNPQYLANWYTVFTSYNKYLSVLEPTINDEEKLGNLTTLRSLLTALEASYLTVLQDRVCNCTDDCTISNPLEHRQTDCQEELNFVFYLLGRLVQSARGTLNKFIINCDCQAPDAPTGQRGYKWFKDNFPTGNDYVYSLMESKML